MRLLPISLCRPGMRLGKKIYNEEGLVLLGEHVELTEALLRRLTQHGICFLYIDDPRTEDIVVRELLRDETRAIAMQTIRTHFRRLMEDSNRKKAVNQQIGKAFREVVGLLIDDLSRHSDAMIMLTSMQLADHYLYQHSLNVCIYATIMGLTQKLSREDLTVFSLGALLHDIGKTQLPPAILTKPGKLTDAEFEAMKQHTVYGFRLLKDEPNISLLSAHCAFQHHERINGSGYPRGIAGDQITDYARWIGVVDSYDAMTTHRVYRDAMLPHQAMEILYTGAGTLYDKDKIEKFRDKIAIYPLGVSVTLSTGESGVVIDLNAAMPQRPIVRILQDPSGHELAEPYEIDLSKKLSIMIAAVGLHSPL